MSAPRLTPIQLDALAVVFKGIDTWPHLGPSVAEAVRRIGIDPNTLIPSLLQAVCERDNLGALLREHGPTILNTSPQAGYGPFGRAQHAIQSALNRLRFQADAPAVEEGARRGRDY